MVEHDSGRHTLPTNRYGNFLAMYQGRADGLEEVFSSETEGYGTMMVIPGNNGVVYITREQAKKFFNLHD